METVNCEFDFSNWDLLFFLDPFGSKLLLRTSYDRNRSSIGFTKREKAAYMELYRIAILRLPVISFSQHWNTFDSLCPL